MLGSGTGGLPELCSALDESMVAYCAIRKTPLTGGGGSGGGGSDRFHRILFVGEEVGGMKRGRAALQKNAVFGVLEGASGGDHEFGSVGDLAAATF